MVSDFIDEHPWRSQMKNIKLPKSQILTFIHMDWSFWSMVKARQGIGHRKSSLLRCIEQFAIAGEKCMSYIHDSQLIGLR